MTGRRVYSINVRFLNGRFSSTHWSPFREKWPKSVQAAVIVLKERMEEALLHGEVKDD